MLIYIETYKHYYSPARERTFAKMGIDTHVARSARKTLVLTVGYVLARLGVDVLLGQSEICRSG
jgi:hypothetical protein